MCEGSTVVVLLSIAEAAGALVTRQQSAEGHTCSPAVSKNMPDFHLLSGMGGLCACTRAASQPVYSLRQQLKLAEHCHPNTSAPTRIHVNSSCPHDTTFRTGAAWYHTWLLMKLTPKGVVISFSTPFLFGIQEQAQNHGSTCTALAAAQEEAKLAEAARQQATSARQELESLRGTHEAVLSELAVAKGRLSAFDESCQHSLDRVQTLSAALQEAHQAKVLPSCAFSPLSATCG